MLRFLGFLFSAGFIVFCGVAAGSAYIIWETSKDLPDYKQLAQYEPPVTTRVHAADGSLLTEYAKERRLFVPIDAVPKQLVEAFLAAEDKTFYEHPGIDWQSLARAMAVNVETLVNGGDRRLVGASTITQQVAKNFLLTSDRTIKRKLREALLALRIEQAFSKNQILELYLNEIFLGLGSYGVAAASLNYFGKPLPELSLAEAAYLAALPKAPNNYHPFRYPDRAIERRNWVLDRMLDNAFVTQAEHDEAARSPLNVTSRPFGAQQFAAESFAEEVRREVQVLYGEDKLYAGGLSIRTTIDPKLQVAARHAVSSGLIKYDRKHGWRGPIRTVPTQGDWGPELARLEAPADVAPWRLALVLEVTEAGAKIGLRPPIGPDGKVSDEREMGAIPLALMTWARRAGPGGLGPEVKTPSDVLSIGDVVYAAPSQDKAAWHLVQLPAIEGALVAMDPHTGRVRALVGGFSYGKSQFNRAVQALRQPGSSIKPFVYAAALDNGYTPASVVLDAPIEFKMSTGEIWKPKNYTGKYHGPSTLRRGIELSRNVMTVRLANDLGIGKFGDLAERLGIYQRMPRHLAMALGAGETTLLKMTTGYSMLANGGKQIQATLIDRIQDRYGKTVYRHDKRDCPGCKTEAWTGQAEPELFDDRAEAINPYTAYQITSMLEGVVERGTGQALKAVGKPIAGKTGTTNEERDSWFIGFTPDLAVGVYIGFDNPQPMGRGATGGLLAAPIVAQFMRQALHEKPATPFRVPPGIQLIPLDPKTGKRGIYGDPNIILEAFKPGEEPGTATMVIGENLAPATGESAVIEGGLTTGTGGLY